MPTDPSDLIDTYWRREAAFPTNHRSIAAASVAPDDFMALADNLPALCWIARADGHIVWFNRRWHDYCGSTPEAMEGRGWRSVLDPALLPQVMARWTQGIASGQPFEMAFPLMGADGVFRPFLSRIVPCRDRSGSILRWFGLNEDMAAQSRAISALNASEAKFQVLTDAMPQMVWSTLPDGYHDYYNAQWYAFTGVPIGSTDGEGWNGMFHPEDQERAWSAWRLSLATGAPYEIEYRLRHHSGAYRWTLGRALPVRNEQGTIQRWIGTCTDVDDAKRVAEQTQLLSHELSHRIKNIFAVIASLIRLSVRRAPVHKAFADGLQARIDALGRAHEFSRPHTEHSRPFVKEQTLHVLLDELLAPYQNQKADRIIVRGGDVAIDDRGATPLALIVHELATNAVKYGPLGTVDGRVEISIAAGDPVVVVWAEQGGPAISNAGQPGFGTHLATLSIERQLNGTIERIWRPEGLRIIMTIPRGQLSRSAI